MIGNNAYDAYSEAGMLSQNPMSLVVALYDGAIDSVRTARLCLESGDIWGRTRAINKGVSILTELMVSLNHEKGGDIAANLKQLYAYMQRRILEAHARKSAAPLEEVEKLLQTMADGWKQAAALSKTPASDLSAAPVGRAPLPEERKSEGDETNYGSYWNDFSEGGAQTAYSF
jgi:flagellar protein FliS